MISESSKFPQKHPKGWGYELWIANSNLYCGKILVFFKGKKFSWHFHEIKDETFYVISGEVLLRWGWSDSLESANVKSMTKGEVFHVPQGMRHQLEAVSDSQIMEVSTHHVEEDSIRIIKGD
jgi:quercetin dioxygenase-like cupin family protein